MATVLDRSLQPEIDLLFGRLINVYSKFDRHCHNLSHINHVITKIEHRS